MKDPLFPQEIFERIHNINFSMNRRLSWLIFIASAIVVFLLLILPYRGRVGLAFIINILFNRPIIYLNFAARFISKPLMVLQGFVVYYVLIGLYALFFKLFVRTKKPGWKPAAQIQSKDDFRYQS